MEIKSEAFITKSEKELVKRRDEKAKVATKLLSTLKKGEEYRCYEVADMLNSKNKNKGKRKFYTCAYIAKIFKACVDAGYMVKTVKDGEPVEIEDLIRDEITVNGKKYYSKESYWGTKTIIPKVSYYSLA